MNTPLFASSPAILSDPGEIAAITEGEWVVPLAKEKGPIRNIAYFPKTLAPASLAVMKLPTANFGFNAKQLERFHDNIVAAMGVDPEPPLPGLPYLRVSGPITAMKKLASRVRRSFTGKVVAVTGSAGKSSCSDMLFRMLRRLEGDEHVAMTEKNENLQLGITRSLCNLSGKETRLVLEIAAGHARVCAEVAQPHVALFTNLSEAHLELYGSLKAIADRKSAIFRHMAPSHTAVLCRDMLLFDRVHRHALESGARVVTYGTHPQADVRPLEYDFESGTVRATFFGEVVEYRLSCQGEHMVLNSLGVLASIRALGDDWRTAAAELACWTPLEGRGTRFFLPLPEGGSAQIIDESFNAAPIAMRAALRMLAQTPGTRRIAVLGEMLELGEARERIHCELSEFVTWLGIDRIYALGDVYRGFWASLPEGLKGEHAETLEQLVAALRRDLRDGDVALFKGSHGSKLYRAVAMLKMQQVAQNASTGMDDKNSVPQADQAAWAGSSSVQPV